jgi:hypothetical protein
MDTFPYPNHPILDFIGELAALAAQKVIVWSLATPRCDRPAACLARLPRAFHAHLCRGIVSAICHGWAWHWMGKEKGKEISHSREGQLLLQVDKSHIFNTHL